MGGGGGGGRERETDRERQRQRETETQRQRQRGTVNLFKHGEKNTQHTTGTLVTTKTVH